MLCGLALPCRIEHYLSGSRIYHLYYMYIYVYIYHNTPQEAERVKKKTSKMFKDLGLKITVDTNAKVVEYL